MYSVICSVGMILFKFIPEHYSSVNRKSTTNVLHAFAGIAGLTIVLPLAVVHSFVYIGVKYVTEAFYGSLLATSQFAANVAAW